MSGGAASGASLIRASTATGRSRGCSTPTAGTTGGPAGYPNGWWRDSAQQLLVLKQDKSVVPALQRMVRTSDSLLGRFHALWTLEWA